MEIFVNELSFHEQFYDRLSFEQAIKVFYSVFTELNRKKIEHRLYWDEDPFQIYKAIKNEVFIASLGKIKDKSQRRALIDILRNKLNVRDWKLDQVHSSDDRFQCNGDCVTNTSLAELAERKLKDTDLMGLLINFPQSKFAHASALVVVKNYDENNPIDLDCVEDKTKLLEWLEVNLRLSLLEYDYTSTSPPIDTQTVLRDQERFRKTSQTFKGSKIYQESSSGYYWYVDSLHYGRAAHLEVFNSRGEHIGEADLDGNLDVSKKQVGRRLRIK